MSAVADYQVESERSRTGGPVKSSRMIDAGLATGDWATGVWSVHLRQWVGLTSANKCFEYTQRRTSQDNDILPHAEPSTGDAFLEVASLPIHPSVGFYTSIAGFVDLHQQLLPRISSVTSEQSRRLTEVLFRNKLVRRLE